jgi:hypothetical protein
MKTRFQSLLFQIQLLCRYASVVFQSAKFASHLLRAARAATVGPLYKLNPVVTHGLKARLVSTLEPIK